MEPVTGPEGGPNWVKFNVPVVVENAPVADVTVNVRNRSTVTLKFRSSDTEIEPFAVPVTDPTLVESVNIPPVKLSAEKSAHPSRCSATLPTAPLPEYVVSNFK